jgi:hypothetical protein
VAVSITQGSNPFGAQDHMAAYLRRRGSGVDLYLSSVDLRCSSDARPEWLGTDASHSFPIGGRRAGVGVWLVTSGCSAPGAHRVAILVP